MVGETGWLPTQICIGLTGGVGSGKTAVSTAFERLGVKVIDADVVCRQVSIPGSRALSRIQAMFGAEALLEDGSLNRKAMRRWLFESGSSGEKNKEKLERILHPLILERIQEEAEVYTTSPYSLIVVPLLFESGDYHPWLRSVITIDCLESVQRQRAMVRDGVSQASIQQMMAAQYTREERKSRANYVVENNGSLEELAQKIYTVHQKILRDIRK